MKKIALLKDHSAFWNDIEKYLAIINADVGTFPPSGSDDEIAAFGADLLIVSYERLPTMLSPLRRFKVMVIGEGDKSFPGQTRASQKRLLFLRWPVSKNYFLRETADILGVSPRKSFQALIRVFTPGSEVGHIGRSIDFSVSGMSFSIERHYPVEQEVSISVSIPNAGGSLLLRGRVTRGWTNEADGSREYGVRFKSLDRMTAETLETFILN